MFYCQVNTKVGNIVVKTVVLFLVPKTTDTPIYVFSLALVLSLINKNKQEDTFFIEGKRKKEEKKGKRKGKE